MNTLPQKAVVTVITALITIGNLFSQETCKYHLAAKTVNGIKSKIGMNDKVNQTLCFKDNHNECDEIYQDGLMFDESMTGIIAGYNRVADDGLLLYGVGLIDYMGTGEDRFRLLKDEFWAFSKDYSIVYEIEKEGKKTIKLIYKRISTEPNDY